MATELNIVIYPLVKPICLCYNYKEDGVAVNEPKIHKLAEQTGGLKNEVGLLF